ncbi:hypothetical protein SLEP1_g33747 [Rubroshorea leprosula]|uniref:Uncharacterized protein n=1 Tax=Rubroshorea leprosula TaxID=152421 RepID=A0AAV5KHU6_9ROSI|nr:hypothetical protein SLEP1_g33747 [Rubroshorea leprosula]
MNCFCILVLNWNQPCLPRHCFALLVMKYLSYNLCT